MVIYFKKFSSDFNKQGLKRKLIITASYFEGKYGFFFFKKSKFSQKNVFFDVNFLRQFLFPANTYVRF